MKTWKETVTRRQGENMGKIDMSYDWNQYNTYPNHPERSVEKGKLLQEIEKLFHDGKKLRVFYSGNFAGEVVDVGMWDGWPFWKPTPSVRLRHWHGCEWHFWYDVNSYKVIKTDDN